jgi:hypothetical protein
MIRYLIDRKIIFWFADINDLGVCKKRNGFQIEIEKWNIAVGLGWPVSSFDFT